MTLAGIESSSALWRRGLSTLSDVGSATHGRAVVILIVFCLLAFLPGVTRIPPIDRDEARFAQATKQMIETGDYVDIRFQDEVRYKKPVGIYWLQAASVKVASALGVRDAQLKIWLYRVPSFIGATGGVLLTYWTALAFASRRAAMLAGIMMASSILLGVEARLAKTDAMLFLTVVAAMGAMGRIYLGEGGAASGVRRKWVLPGIFWTAIAVGVLIKGPLILMLVGLTAIALIAFDRNARWLLALRPALGLLWLAVLVLPWFAAIVLKSGNAFFSESVGQDLLSKVASGQESHGAPPGYYAVLFFVTFWPACIFSGLAAPAIWRDRRQPQTRFLLAWVVPSWIVFELVVTKLPHYVLPLYPAIAILMAARIVPNDLSRQIWLERGGFWWFAVPLVVGLGAIVGLGWLGGKPGLLAMMFTAAAIIFGFRAWWLYGADGYERSMLRAAAASILLSIAIYARIVPFLPNLFPSPVIAHALQDSGCQKPLAAAAGYHEPSLVFLVGTETLLTDGAGAAEFLRKGPCRFALIEARHERSFAQRADAIGLRYTPLPRVEGVNAGAARNLSVAIFRSGE
jgi:4-amino-4-deoxy-L-arabinose transferase-like glycosyltransferase